MLVTIVNATDQRGSKLVGVGWPLDIEALKVKGLFRQKETLLWIIQKRKNIGLKYTIWWTHVLQILFCLLIPRSSFAIAPRKEEGRKQNVSSLKECTHLVSQDGATPAFAITMTFLYNII